MPINDGGKRERVYQGLLYVEIPVRKVDGEVLGYLGAESIDIAPKSTDGELVVVRVKNPAPPWVFRIGSTPMTRRQMIKHLRDSKKYRYGEDTVTLDGIEARRKAGLPER